MSQNATQIDKTDRSNYKHWTKVSLRYGDTDRLGHVNNAVFVTLLEAGRVEVLFEGADSRSGSEHTFVIANINLDFRAEIHYPGFVEVGTTVFAIGRSSVKMRQVLIKDGVCCATSESTIVLIDQKTRKSTPIPDDLRSEIERIAG